MLLYILKIKMDFLLNRLLEMLKIKVLYKLVKKLINLKNKHNFKRKIIYLLNI